MKTKEYMKLLRNNNETQTAVSTHDVRELSSLLFPLSVANYLSSLKTSTNLDNSKINLHRYRIQITKGGPDRDVTPEHDTYRLQVSKRL